MKKLLIGGSPCQHWSIGNSNGRETEPYTGSGWELFKCYLAAKEKFQPDFFLYENNQSAAQMIKDAISDSLGYPIQYINSSLVSAQSRKRLYVHNLGDIGQPEECGLVVKDILDDFDDEIHYILAHASKVEPDPNKLIRLGDIGTTGQGNRVYSHEGKSATLTANGGGMGGKTGLYSVPVRLGDIGSDTQSARIYSHEGKSRTITSGNGGRGSNTGLYTVPLNDADKKDCELQSPSASEEKKVEKIHSVVDGQIKTDYGLLNVNLPDGDYIIRKLKPVECERLQTLPDGYTEGISKTQRYKCLGNGWTAKVIEFILSHMDIDKDEELIVLSMFDGIGTGRYVLDQLGFTNIKYYAYEIDKNAIQVAKKNYPDIIELGDAFQLMEEDWHLDY